MEILIHIITILACLAASIVIAFIIMGFVMTGIHSREADKADIKAFGKIQR